MVMNNRARNERKVFSMMMTNYMEVLMSNQPWNLIAFMVLPVAMKAELRPPMRPGRYV